MNRQMFSDQVSEQALEPDLPIIDTHIHLWSISPAARFESYDHEASFADMTDSGHNIVGTIIVDSTANYRTHGPEHLRAVGETEYAEWVAEEGVRRGGRLAGACVANVSTANLLKGAGVAEELDAHMAASTRFRGIRHMTAFDHGLEPIYGASEPNIMTRPEFREGLVELSKRGLSLDAWLFHPQLPELVALARSCPDSRIILNHVGGPIGIGRYAEDRAGAFAEWKASMTELAKCDNVFLKLGALNMDYSGMAPTDPHKPFTSEEMAERQGEHILTSIEIFGADRCMFESNFPVDMVFTSYTLLWNAFKRITKELSASEKNDLYSGTARRVYRIENLPGDPQV